MSTSITLKGMSHDVICSRTDNATEMHPEQLLKFGLAAALGVPLCFSLAFLVRQIPFATRIL